MNGLLWIIVFLIALVVFIKFSEIKAHFVYRVFGVMILLLCLSGGYVWIKSGINPFSYGGFLDLGRTYYSWLGNLLGNTKGVTGYAVQQDWGINSTVSP